MIAIRGAVRVPRNDREAIYHETQRLLREMRERNGFEQADVVSAFFTMTPDLNADFPAYAARSMGWTEVPMLGAQETPVPGAMDRMVRVLLHVEGAGPAHHVYLGEAAAMRPDLARADATRIRSTDLSTPAEFGPVLTCGLGLIGGSLCLALRRSGRFAELLGQDPDPRARELALAAGAVSAAQSEAAELLRRAAIVILAMPVERILSWLHRSGPKLPRGTIVLDVGSTKAAIVKAMEALPEGVEAIGTHPMAGSEQSGMGAARPDLFYGSTWALVETGRTGARARAVATAIVETAGAKPLFVDAEEHDRATALTSHLPYLVSGALATGAAEAATEEAARALAGPGLRDMTRLAASDPSLMAGILATNWEHVEEALEGFRRGVERLLDSLRPALPAAGGDPDEAGRVVDSLIPELGRLRTARDVVF
ncbi:MAG: chorismate mutase [Gemmatimonadota bacterium]